MEPVGNKFNWILDNDCSSCSSLFFLWLFSFPFCDFFSFLRFEMQGFTQEVLSKKFPLCSNTHIELDKAIIILVNMLQYQKMAKPDRWKQEDVTKGYQDQRPRKKGFCFIRTMLQHASHWFQWLLWGTVALNWSLSLFSWSDYHLFPSIKKTFDWEPVFQWCWHHICCWLFWQI